MVQWIRKLAFVALALGLCAGVAGCGEDGKDSFNKPSILSELVEPMWEMWEATGEKTNDCNALNTIIAKYGGGDYTTTRTTACSEYAAAYAEAGNSSKKLTENQTNSGYYMTTYILVSKLYNQAKSCQKDKEFEAMFNVQGCNTLLETANNIAKSRER